MPGGAELRENIVVFDDRRLAETGADRRRSLFPLLAFAPGLEFLAIWVATIAAVYALRWGGLSLSGALWGLRCLEQASATDGLAPVGLSPSAGSTWIWQPDLAVWWHVLWLNAASGNVQWVFNTLAVLSVIALLIACFHLAKVVGGARLGLITVIMLATNPFILQQSAAPGPFSLGLALFVTSVACWLSARRTTPRWLSWRLCVACLSMLGAFLTVGPVAVLGLMAVWTGWLLGSLVRRSFSPVLEFGNWPQSPGLDAGRLFLWLTLPGVVLLGISFRAMGQASGWAAVWSWILWTSPDTSLAALQLDPLPLWEAVDRLRLAIMPLTALAITGLYRIWRTIGRGDDGDTGRLVVVAWGGLAVLVWIVGQNSLITHAVVEQAWRTFLMPPMAILAGFGVCEIIERRVRHPFDLVVVWLAIAELGLYLARLFATPHAAEALTFQPDLWSRLWVILSAGLLWVALSVGGRLIAETQRREWLRWLLLVLLVEGAVWGGLASRQRSDVDAGLTSLREVLSRIPSPEQCVLVTDERRTWDGRFAGRQADEAAVYLRFAFRGAWGETRFAAAANWEAAASRYGKQVAELVARPLGVNSSPRSRPLLFVTWGPRGRAKLAGSTLPLRAVTPLLTFRDTDVYVFEPALPQPAYEDPDSDMGP